MFRGGVLLGRAQKRGMVSYIKNIYYHPPADISAPKKAWVWAWVVSKSVGNLEKNSLNFFQKKSTKK